MEGGGPWTSHGARNPTALKTREVGGGEEGEGKGRRGGGRNF